jgi:hypothetical protein
MLHYSIAPHNNDILLISGKTFEYREKIKALGGKWHPKSKSWTISNSITNINIIKGINEVKETSAHSKNRVRRCGFCQEAGHFKPRCQKYLTQLKKQLDNHRRKAMTPPKHWQRLKRFNPETTECQCVTKEVIDEALNESYKQHYVCWNCQHFCCEEATSKGVNVCFGYQCKKHGTHTDTSGD